MGTSMSVSRHRKDEKNEIVDKYLGYAVPFKKGIGYSVTLDAGPNAINGTIELFIRKKVRNGVMPEWNLTESVDIYDKNNKVVATKQVKDCALRCVSQWNQKNVVTGEVEPKNHTLGFAYFLREKSKKEGEEGQATAEMRVVLEEMPLPSYDQQRDRMTYHFKVFMPKTKSWANDDSGNDVPDETIEEDLQ